MSISGSDASLYIPVRNAGRTLAAAIESVRAQRVQPREFFLVVDVRSSDDSVAIARRSGLRIVEQTDGRLGHARNLALSACRTPWLASCDADVSLEPGWLAALLARADAGVGAVGGGTEERLITPADRWRAVNLPHNWGPAAFDNPFMLVSEMLARVEAFRTIGGYRPDLQNWEDSDACQRLRQAGFTLRYEPAAVAWHDRRDTIAAVLELRWSYAYYRQRTRLESLDGLIEKLPINRTYCLQSLSQTLHGPHPETAAIALWLWFHHARRDLRAALAQWPLLTPDARAQCDGRVVEALADGLGERWPQLTRDSGSVIAPVSPSGDARPAGGGRAESADNVSPRASLAATTGFDRYVSALRSATRELRDAIPGALDEALESSAAELADAGRRHFEAPSLCLTAADRERLAACPMRRAWRWPELRAALADLTTIADGEVGVLGRSLPDEQPFNLAPAAAAVDRSADVLLIPHVEQFAAPRDALERALADCRERIVVVAYQPPDLFVPAIPILSARDLAASASGAGFEILNFSTQAGLTRLVLRRAGSGRVHAESRLRSPAGASAPVPRC